MCHLTPFVQGPPTCSGEFIFVCFQLFCQLNCSLRLCFRVTSNDPDLVLPDVTTVIQAQDNLLNEIEKACLSQLAKAVAFSTFADVWTSGAKHSFIGMNVEFMRRDFRRARFTLDLVHLTQRHTADHLKSEMNTVLRKLKIEHGINVPMIAMISDNGSNLANNLPNIDEEDPWDDDLDEQIFRQQDKQADFSFEDLNNNENLPKLPGSTLTAASVQQALEEMQVHSEKSAPKAKWYGDPCHTLLLSVKGALKASKAALSTISLAQAFNRTLKGSTTWMDVLRREKIPLPTLDIEVRWSSLLSLLSRWKEIAERCRQLDTRADLPIFNNKDITNANSLITILKLVVECLKGLQVADGHCGCTVVGISDLVERLRKADCGFKVSF